MRATIRLLVFLWALMLIVPVLAQPGLPGMADPSAAAKAKMLSETFVDGRLARVDPGTGMFSVQCNTMVKVSNPEMDKQYADLYKQFQQATKGDKKKKPDPEKVKAITDQAQQLVNQMWQPLSFEVVLKGTEELKIQGSDSKPLTVQDLSAGMPVRFSIDKTKPRAPAMPGAEVYPVSLIMVAAAKAPEAPIPQGPNPGVPGGQPTMAPPVDQTAMMKAKMLGGPYLEGRLLQVDPKEAAFTLQVPTKVPDMEAHKTLNDLKRQYGEAIRKKNNQEQVKALMEQGNEVSKRLYQDATFDFQMKGTEELKVRFLNQPPEKPPETKTEEKKPDTPEEKKDAKPEETKPKEGETKASDADANLPGFPASVQDLSTGLAVRIFLDRAKMRDPQSAGATSYPVSMIVILNQKAGPLPPPPSGGN